MPKECFMLLGPEHPNDAEQVLAWNTEWGWVLPELATMYDERILTAPLPRGTQAVVDVQSDVQHMVSPSRWVGV